MGRFCCLRNVKFLFILGSLVLNSPLLSMIIEEDEDIPIASSPPISSIILTEESENIKDENLVNDFKQRRVTLRSLGATLVEQEKEYKSKKRASKLIQKEEKKEEECIKIKEYQELKNIIPVTSLNLQDAAIDDYTAQYLSLVLAKDPLITEVNFSGNKIGDNTAEFLALTLRGRSSITHLDLTRTKITSKGGASLFKSIRKNTSLTSFKLSILSDWTYTSSTQHSEFLELMKKSLINNKTLQNLKLHFGKIDENEIQVFNEIFKVNKTITDIDLSDNSVNEKSAQIFINGLFGNKSIKTLNLSNNKIKNGGLQEIIRILEVSKNKDERIHVVSKEEIKEENAEYHEKRNKTPYKELLLEREHKKSNNELLHHSIVNNSMITKLILSNNLIDEKQDKDKTLSAGFTVMLGKNNTLTSLDLSINMIGDELFKAIVEGLKKNTKLKFLDLQKNQIKFKDGFLLENFKLFLEQNNTLQHLYLMDNTVLGGQLKEWQNILEEARNYTLEIKCYNR